MIMAAAVATMFGASTMQLSPYGRLLVDLIVGRCSPLRVALLCCCAIAFVGCNRGPAVAQVSGRVKFKDGSIPTGGVRMVRFEPAADTPSGVRMAASGGIQSDGSFTMARHKPGDGVYCGKYHVTFTVWKAPREPISLIADEYTNSETTPYHITVDQDTDDLVFEIEPLK